MRAIALSPAFTLALLLGGCATDALDQTFGPSGRSIREEIATWPAEQREAFDLMKERCTTCHQLSQPLAAHVPAGGWGAVVRKMARKPRAAIPAADAGRIAAFLEYFQERRATASGR